MKNLFETHLLTLIVLMLVAVSATHAQSGIDEFKALDIKFDTESLLSAVKAYSECVKYNPAAKDCVERRGAAYFYLKDYDKALEDFNEALTSDSKKPFVLYCRGSIFASRANYDAALADFNKANELLPNERKILIARSQTYRAKKNYQAALADLNRLLTKNSPDFQAFYERAMLYDEQRNYELAVADYSKAIVLNPAFADAYFKRGQAYANLKNTAKSRADFVSAAKLDRKYAGGGSKITDAGARSPIVKSSSVLTTAGAETPSWKRTVLRETGISVESPEAFVLLRDTPDPLLETQTAYVFWTLTAGDVFANVLYEKDSAGKSARQTLDSSAEVSGGSHKVTSSVVTETTFDGQPAAILDQQYFDAKKNKEIRLLQFCFGKPGDLTTFTAVYPAADAAAKTTALKIYNSIRAEGERIAETPKMAPANWHFAELNGLHYETPTNESNAKCRSDFLQYYNAVDCFNWSYLTVRIGYRKYASASAAQSSAKLAVEEADSYKEMNKASILNDKVDFRLDAFPVSGAEATKLKIVTSGRADVFSQEIIFIRRGVELWKVDISHTLRWKFDDEATERIIKSLQKFPLAGEPSAAPPAVLTDLDRYERDLKDLGAGKTLSDEEIKWALQYEKNHPKKKID